MSITYRTTDALRWGAGVGRLLAAAEVDGSFYTLDQAIAAATSHLDSSVVSIAYVSLSGNQLTVVLTDHSRQGPFTIPTAQFIWAGPWTADTDYSRGALVTTDNALYFVIETHVSGAHFSADAMNGSHHPLYGLVLAPPDGVLPPHGTTGQVLVKASAHDFDVEWATVIGVPAGGTNGQVLAKSSDHDYDIGWATLPNTIPPPPNFLDPHLIAYTLQASDLNTYMIVDSTHDVVITIPLNLAKIGDEVHFRQQNTGRILIDAAFGVALPPMAGFLNETPIKGAVCTIKVISANGWDIYGLLTAHP